MLDASLEIRDFDPQTASYVEFEALNAFWNQMRAEASPEDPPTTVEQTVSMRRSQPPFVQVREWAVWRNSQMVGQAYFAFLRVEENQHLGEFSISVLPEMRRQGIARTLLGQVAAATQEEGRRLLITYTSSRVPAGSAFTERLGAQMAYAAHSSQLDLDDLNRALVSEWQAEALAPRDEYELGLWEGPYPEQSLEAIAKLQAVMNTAPRGELEVEDSRMTPERLRQQESSLAQQGVERWTVHVRHLASGQLAGYTEVLWNPKQPEVLSQGDTGVFPEHRNRGLGRWLKAAMVAKVLRERPQVKRIRTANAVSNAPMLRINEEMGFRPYQSNFHWQVGIDQVIAYLAQGLEA